MPTTPEIYVRLHRSGTVRRWWPIFLVLALAGCAGQNAPVGSANGGDLSPTERISGEILAGTEAWPPGSPGYVHAAGTSFFFNSTPGGQLTIFGNWTPETSLAETLEWQLLKDRGGAVISREKATMAFTVTLDADPGSRYRIDIHTVEGGAMVRQVVHLDVVGPKGLTKLG